MLLKTPNKVIKSIQMLDDTTVEIVFNDNILIELEDLKEGYRILSEVTEDKKLKKLLVTGRRTEITKDARLFGFENSVKIKDKVIAEAIIVHSLYQKMIINLYSKFIREAYPTKYFTDFEKAKLWLKSF